VVSAAGCRCAARHGDRVAALDVPEHLVEVEATAVVS
jgi:hypothetical protein